MFWTITLRASLLESIPQREMGRWREREGKERARGRERERERDWEGESSREDGSPLHNDGIAVKLAQAEGSDDTHTFGWGDPRPVCEAERSREEEESREMTLTTVQQLFLLNLLWLCGTWSPTGGRTFCSIQQQPTRQEEDDEDDD